MRTINRRSLESAIYECGLPIDAEGVVRADYSGRCMYGESCFGLVLDDDRQLAQLFARLGEQVYCDGMPELDFSPSELAESMRSDSMGRSATIYYFPGWQLEGDAALDEEAREIVAGAVVESIGPDDSRWEEWGDAHRAEG